MHVERDAVMPCREAIPPGSSRESKTCSGSALKRRVTIAVTGDFMLLERLVSSPRTTRSAESHSDTVEPSS
jgi:hypothetical protein